MKDNRQGISIQVGLSGYSFKIQADDEERASGWMGAEKIFNTPELQRRYDEVSVSVFTPKCAMVPSQFYSPENSKAMLSDVVNLADDDIVESVEVPEYAAVLLFSSSAGGTLARVISETVLMLDGTKARPLPELYFMMSHLTEIHDYNKIMASYMDGCLYLIIAQGKTLLLCNVFQAPDFTTAEYFIFLAMKKLQLNPEVSSIYFRTELQEDQEMSLYRYFKNVEKI